MWYDFIVLLISPLAVPLMAYLGRTAGGGQKADEVWSGLPELLFGSVIGLAVWYVTGVWWLALIGGLFSYGAMEKGHGNFFAMQGVKPGADDPEDLERWGFRTVFTRYFKGDIHTPAYSWWMMAVKGFLIGLPLFPMGLILVGLWPAAYSFGYAVLKRAEASEWYSSGSAGLAVTLYVAAAAIAKLWV